MTKQDKLDREAKIVDECTVCRVDRVGVAVFGEGNPDADVMFIGEAPGKLESETGRPFVGRSGKLLREAIRGAGLLEKDVYITSPVKYLPTYKTPNYKDIEHGMTHLSKQIEIIDPKILVLLGNVATVGVLGKGHFIAKEHGSIVKRDGKNYFLSYHPAAAIRFAKIKPIFLKDFQLLPALIKSNS
ncbi:MAG TPA: uracil-DNA glycosylase [Patescibacteria group bacterium]|nr:uracil-DNA glycosylase [Patescibacteria group bacterium]